MIEAVALVRPASQIAWDVTTAGRIFVELKDFYPTEPEIQNALQAQIGQVGDSSRTSGLSISSGTQSLWLSDDDGGRKLSVSPQHIAVHGMPPYEGWEALRDRLRRDVAALASTLKIADVYAQVAVRYVNRIEISGDSLGIDDYLTIAYTMSSTFPKNVSAVLDHVEMFDEGDPTKFSFTFGTVDAEPGKQAFHFGSRFYFDPLMAIRRLRESYLS